MKPVSLVHYGDISAIVDQAMSKKKNKTKQNKTKQNKTKQNKKTKQKRKYMQKHTQFFRPNWSKFSIREEFLINFC